MTAFNPNIEPQRESIRSKLPIHTHNGQVLTIGQLDHQHLSNWIHYSTWIHDNEELKELFNEELKERFGGHLLDYRPKSTYDYEIAELHRKGMLGRNGMIFNPLTSELIGVVDYD